jgi:hypothetical protein
MSLYDYQISEKLALEDYPFYSLIMAAMRKADTDNTVKLKACWPEIWRELERRYHAASGLLPEDNV